MKRKRILCALLTLTVVLALLCIPAFAAGTGDVASAVESTWNAAKKAYWAKDNWQTFIDSLREKMIDKISNFL